MVQRHATELVDPPLPPLRTVAEILRQEIEASFGAMVEVARGADLLLSGAHFAAASAAEAHGIPLVTLLHCPQLVRSRHHPPPGVPWFTLPRLVNDRLWAMLSDAVDLAFGETINRHRRRHGLSPISRIADSLYGDRIVVASDPLLGGLPVDVPPGTMQIGSIAYADPRPLDPALERFLERGEPPIYVGFGSMPDPAPQATTTLVVESLGACNRRGVIQSGWARLGQGGVPPGMFIVSDVPHAALFPRVPLAVHHGGSGTTAAAARAGIGQVVVPHSADQYYWGEQVWRRGLGSRPIPRTALTAGRLARAIHAALTGEFSAEKASAVRNVLERTDAVSALARIVYEAAGEGTARRRAA
jgi:vancomycin aglycone glucosyltransferase